MVGVYYDITVILSLYGTGGVESVEHFRVAFLFSSTITFCGRFVMSANDSKITASNNSRSKVSE